MTRAPFRPFTFLLLVTAINVLMSHVSRAQSEPGEGAHLPIEFEPNRGQLAQSALYLARTKQLSVALEKAQVNAVLAKPGLHETSEL